MMTPHVATIQEVTFVNHPPYDTQKVVDTVYSRLNGSEVQFMDAEKMTLFLWFASLTHASTYRVALLKEKFTAGEHGPIVDTTHLRLWDPERVYEVVSNPDLIRVIDDLKFAVLYTPNTVLSTVVRTKNSAWSVARSENRVEITYSDMVADTTYVNSLREDFSDVLFFE